MSSLRLLNSHGDTLIATWDETKTDTPDAQAAIAEATRIIETETRKGSSLFKTPEGEPAIRVGKFDPTEQGEYAMIPRLVGG